jgi:hypothetical protein
MPSRIHLVPPAQPTRFRRSPSSDAAAPARPSSQTPSCARHQRVLLRHIRGASRPPIHFLHRQLQRHHRAGAGRRRPRRQPAPPPAALHPFLSELAALVEDAVRQGRSVCSLEPLQGRIRAETDATSRLGPCERRTHCFVPPISGQPAKSTHLAILPAPSWRFVLMAVREQPTGVTDEPDEGPPSAP